MKNNSSIAMKPPQSLLDDIIIINVQFFDFKGKEQEGIIEVHAYIKNDIHKLFQLIHRLKFPLSCVRPIAEFDGSDDDSMRANNTSAFNFRTVALDPERISNHGYGLAIDINPVQNPYIKDTIILPPHAEYIESEPGTMTKYHPITIFMKQRGFVWGGDWNKPYLDYQHFHKDPSTDFLEKYKNG